MNLSFRRKEKSKRGLIVCMNVRGPRKKKENPVSAHQKTSTRRLPRGISRLVITIHSYRSASFWCWKNPTTPFFLNHCHRICFWRHEINHNNNSSSRKIQPPTQKDLRLFGSITSSRCQLIFCSLSCCTTKFIGLSCLFENL